MTKATTTSRQRGFTAYRPYVAALRDLAGDFRSSDDWNERATAALNGQASFELRKVIPLKTRRRSGAFFTGSDLAARLTLRCGKFDKRSIIHDPSLGMGDLLVAAAQKLPLRRTLNETLEQWGRQLTGRDIQSEFVEGAKTRLVILAQQRHGLKSLGVISVAGLFPGIRVADGLSEHKMYARATHLALNPPFGLMCAPDGCKWAGGQITTAAIFALTAVERGKPDGKLVAILPDVLRTGSRYAKWRHEISKRLIIQRIQPYGRFDDHADIDVFIMEGVLGNGAGKSVKWWDTGKLSGSGLIGQLFDVSVGAVVPHRDPHKGQWSPFATSKTVPSWQIVKKIGLRRRFEGTKARPPFVTIRRTSSPRDPERAIGSIVVGKVPVAVENHLIVLKPKSGGQETCEFVLQKLKDKRTKTWLDKRIRCRHLTVGVLRDLPIWD